MYSDSLRKLHPLEQELGQELGQGVIHQEVEMVRTGLLYSEALVLLCLIPLSYHCCMNQMYSNSPHPLEQELGQELGQELSQEQGLVHQEVEMVRTELLYSEALVLLYVSYPISYHCCMNQMYSDSLRKLHLIKQEPGQGLRQGQGLVHLDMEVVRMTIF